jgi:hypothetical protein
MPQCVLVRRSGSVTQRARPATIARRLSAPIDVGALKVWIDPASFLWSGILTPGPKQRVAMPLPNDANLTGIALYLQTIHLEGAGVAASPGVEFTIL